MTLLHGRHDHALCGPHSAPTHWPADRTHQLPSGRFDLLIAEFCRAGLHRLTDLLDRYVRDGGEARRSKKHVLESARISAFVKPWVWRGGLALTAGGSSPPSSRRHRLGAARADLRANALLLAISALVVGVRLLRVVGATTAFVRSKLSAIGMGRTGSRDDNPRSASARRSGRSSFGRLTDAIG